MEVGDPHATGRSTGRRQQQVSERSPIVPTTAKKAKRARTAAAPPAPSIEIAVCGWQPPSETYHDVVAALVAQVLNRVVAPGGTTLVAQGASLLCSQRMVGDVLHQMDLEVQTRHGLVTCGADHLAAVMVGHEDRHEPAAVSVPNNEVPHLGLMPPYHVRLARAEMDVIAFAVDHRPAAQPHEQARHRGAGTDLKVVLPRQGETGQQGRIGFSRVSGRTQWTKSQAHGRLALVAPTKAQVPPPGNGAARRRIRECIGCHRTRTCTRARRARG